MEAYHRYEEKNISQPGETIGCNQLISAPPGLVPQTKGLLTRARIWAATIYIDYVTGYVHVGLMQDQSGDSTIQAKHDFEHLCATWDVKVKHYHADNGRFAERSFTDDVKKSLQRITFCGVGALETLFHIVCKTTFCETTIIGMIMLNFYVPSCTKVLKVMLGLKS